MKFTQSKSRFGLTALFAAALAGICNLAPAATVSLTPIADTTLQQAFRDNNFGGGTSITAGGRRQGGAARGLLQFDIAASLPAGVTVDSASLGLTVVAVPAGGLNSVFDLHRVQAAWGEGNGSDHGGTPGGAGQATWNNRFGSGTPWTMAGGDFSGTVSASRAIAGFGNYTFSSTANLVADVQSWLDSPASNFGWLLVSQAENSATSIRRFGSRDDVTNRPVLTIQYTLVPEPSTLALGTVGLLTAAVFTSRRRPT